MPFLQFYTTLPANKIPENFQLKTAQILTQVLKDKPLERICVHLFTDQKIFSGSDPEGNEPNAYGVLRSVGRVSAEENRKTIAVLTQHVNQELGIKDNQFRFFFIDLDPNLCGGRGKIFADFGL